MLFILTVLSFSLIPSKYHSLVNEALKSSESKIPRELREETKYPGYYENQNYQFSLLTTLTSKSTNDIKGFAFNDHSCAIVKRKSFNISGKYAVVDVNTQKIFLVNRPIASDGNIDVFDFQELNIFSIMTNFKLETSTESQIDTFPLNSTYRARQPKANIDFNKKWDNNRDRPSLQTFSNDCNVQVGAGAQLKMGTSLSFQFKSIWDVSVTFRLNLDGKLGAEILIPDNTSFTFEAKTLFKVHSPIPSLGVETNFLGLQISIGAFINIDFDILNLEINIPIQINYFKGYHFQASKYFQITPTSISDSSWDINLNELPPADSIKDVFKAIIQSILRATLQISPFFSLEFNLGNLRSQLNVGLRFPFIFDFSQDTHLCTYPYIKANVTIPMKVFCNFTGISYKNIDIIRSYAIEIVFKVLRFSISCIGSKNINGESYDNLPGKSSELVGYLINNSDFYEERRSNTSQVSKKIKTYLTYYDASIDSENPFNSYISPLMNLDSQKKKADQSIVFCSHPSIPNGIAWSLLYFDSDHNFITSNDTFDKPISDFSSEKSFDIQLRKGQNDNSDVTYLTSTIEEIPIYYESKKYTRKRENEYLYITGSSNNYTLLVIDQNGNRFVDKNCSITPYNLISDQQAKNSKPGFIEMGNYDYKAKIISSEIKEDNVSLKMEIYETITVNDIEKDILITSFVTPILNIGDVYTQDYFPNIHFNHGDKLYIKGEIFTSNSTHEDFISNESFIFRGESEVVFTFILTESVKFTFSFCGMTPLVNVKTSITNPYPLIESVIQIVNMNDFIIRSSFSIYDSQILLSPYNEYVILRFEIPEEHRHHKLLIMSLGIIQSLYHVLTFIDEDCQLLDEQHAIIDIQGKEIVDVLMARKGAYGVEFQFRYLFVTTPDAGLIISENGYSFKLMPNVPSVMLLPFYNGRAAYTTLYPDLKDGEKVQVLRLRSQIGDYGLYAFSNKENTSIDCTVYLLTTTIGDVEPNVTIDFSSYQPYLDRYQKFTFFIRAVNGIRVVFHMNGEQFNSNLVNNEAEFNITDVSQPITFTSICANNTERACLIEYPAPKETGYHLIRYPNRDGISITGRGFLAEIVFVEKGKSLTYSKTYTGSITTIKEYKLTDKVSVKLKIRDNKKANYKITQNGGQNIALQDDEDDSIYLSQTRQICLVDISNNDILPFSRKQFDENLFDMLDRLGIDSNGDLLKLTNDENGCLVFGPELIASNKFDRLTNDFCDLPLADSITEVDTSEMHFKDSAEAERERKKKIIIFSGVATGVLLIIIIIIIVCCVKRRL